MRLPHYTLLASCAGCAASTHSCVYLYVCAVCIHVRRRAWSGLPPPAILSSAATTRSSSTSGCVAALTATHGITSLRMPALAAIATLATAATVAAALTAALAAHRSLSKAKTLATPTSPLRSQSHALLSP